MLLFSTWEKNEMLKSMRGCVNLKSTVRRDGALVSGHTGNNVFYEFKFFLNYYL